MGGLEEKIKAFLSIGYDFSIIEGGDYGNDYGYGYGYGWSSGEGYDFGYGSGSGDGYGSGSGDGNGYSNGYDCSDECDSSVRFYLVGGTNVLNYNGHKVYAIDRVPTLIYSVHSNYAKGAILENDLSLQPCFIAKVGDSFAHAETLKQAIADATSKELKNLPIEDRIGMFMNEFPTLYTKASGKKLFDWHHILTGSCEMGRKQFCQAHDVSMTTEYPIEYFLNITKDSYGGNVIRKLRERYEADK